MVQYGVRRLSKMPVPFLGANATCVPSPISACCSQFKKKNVVVSVLFFTIKGVLLPTQMKIFMNRLWRESERLPTSDVATRHAPRKCPQHNVRVWPHWQWQGITRGDAAASSRRRATAGKWRAATWGHTYLPTGMQIIILIFVYYYYFRKFPQIADSANCQLGNFHIRDFLKMVMRPSGRTITRCVVYFESRRTGWHFRSYRFFFLFWIPIFHCLNFFFGYKEVENRRWQWAFSDLWVDLISL
jgi:hypothetical protein